MSIVSIVLYVMAACFYIAANTIAWKMKSVAQDAGNWINPFELPGQGKRFVAFAVCLVASFACVVAGRSLQLGYLPSLSEAVKLSETATTIAKHFGL